MTANKYVLRRKGDASHSPYATCDGQYWPYTRDIYAARHFDTVHDVLLYVSRHPNMGGDTLWIQGIQVTAVPSIKLGRHIL